MHTKVIDLIKMKKKWKYLRGSAMIAEDVIDVVGDALDLKVCRLTVT